MKYEKGIFIGRFQPFHKGHLNVIELMQKECKKIIIGIGSAQLKSEDKNPLNYYARENIIKKVLENSNIDFEIVRVDDKLNDDEWMNYILETNFNVLYSGNQLVLDIAKGLKEKEHSNIEIIDVLPLIHCNKSKEISATKVRELIRSKKDDWKDMVPPEIIDLLVNRYIKYF